MENKVRIRCNLCGKKLDLFDLQQNFHVGKRLDYGSQFDGDRLELRLCNDCMDSLIGRCLISPITLKAGR